MEWRQGDLIEIDSKAKSNSDTRASLLRQVPRLVPNPTKFVAWIDEFHHPSLSSEFHVDDSRCGSRTIAWFGFQDLDMIKSNCSDYQIEQSMQRH